MKFKKIYLEESYSIPLKKAIKKVWEQECELYFNMDNSMLYTKYKSHFIKSDFVMIPITNYKFERQHPFSDESVILETKKLVSNMINMKLSSVIKEIVFDIHLKNDIRSSVLILKDVNAGTGVDNLEIVYAPISKINPDGTESKYLNSNDIIELLHKAQEIIASKPNKLSLSDLCAELNVRNKCSFSRYLKAFPNILDVKLLKYKTHSDAGTLRYIENYIKKNPGKYTIAELAEKLNTTYIVMYNLCYRGSKKYGIEKLDRYIKNKEKNDTIYNDIKIYKTPKKEQFLKKLEKENEKTLKKLLKLEKEYNEIKNNHVDSLKILLENEYYFENQEFEIAKLNYRLSILNSTASKLNTELDAIKITNILFEYENKIEQELPNNKILRFKKLMKTPKNITILKLLLKIEEDFMSWLVIRYNIMKQRIILYKSKNQIIVQISEAELKVLDKIIQEYNQSFDVPLTKKKLKSSIEDLGTQINTIMKGVE